MIDEKKFSLYLSIRDSGYTNMFDLKSVIALSKNMLTRDDCIDIMENFGDYNKKFGGD